MTEEQKALIERAGKQAASLKNTAQTWRRDSLHSWALNCEQDAELFTALAAELKRAAEENAKLREIICNTARELGSLISPEGSVEFLSGVQEEARLVRDRLAKCEPIIEKIRGIQDDLENDHKDRAWDGLAELRTVDLPEKHVS